MFKIETVKGCPVTAGTLGRLVVPTWLIGELAGTLERERGEEWLVLLRGDRSADGLEVVVREISIPADQTRDGGSVDLPGGVDRGDDVVGVLHSHHEMGAFFSKTDHTQLNPRFPLSIVISSRVEDEEDTLLGFSYLAEGRVTLPCGSVGTVRFVVVPEGVEDWPFLDLGAGEFAADPDTSLNGCHHPVVEEVGSWKEKATGKCGLTSEVEYWKSRVFGVGEGGLAAELPAAQKWVAPVVVDKRSGKGALVELATPTGTLKESQHGCPDCGWYYSHDRGCRFMGSECEWCGDPLPQGATKKWGDWVCDDCVKDSYTQRYYENEAQGEGFVLGGRND